MKRVYTKTGDKGTTGIHGGARVPKDDIRIEANGCLDELNARCSFVSSFGIDSFHTLFDKSVGSSKEDKR
jgi:cob(I)alamin adenosyltransferase